MRKICTLFFICLCFNNIFSKELKPLYKFEDNRVIKSDKNAETKTYLVGSNKGLFKVLPNDSIVALWEQGSVEQILRTEIFDENSKLKEVWYFRTSKGILFSSDLQNFELKNEGLPFLTIKNYDGTNTTFEKVVHQLKDLCINPGNSKQMVTATKDNVYYSNDGGNNWQSLGSMSKNISGVKSVAIADMPIFDTEEKVVGTELVVFMSHPIFGFSYKKVNSKSGWKDVTAGFEMIKTMASSDEIADILPVLTQTPEGIQYCDIYASQTFLPRIYKFNWETKIAECIYKENNPVKTFDSLTLVGTNILYTENGGFSGFNILTSENSGEPQKASDWKKTFSSVPGNVNSAYIPHNKSGFKEGVSLGELWLLYPGTITAPYGEIARDKKCVYASAYQCRNQTGIDKYKKIVLDNKCNGIVIDMKDDYGLLRYDTRDDLVKSKAKVTQYAVNLDHFVEEFKKENIYLVARIVVFKDRNLSRFGNSKYAVWDSKNNRAWLGIREYNNVTNEETGEITENVPEYYDENWVDPYCPEVWEYNVAIGKELISRGFDEIQFDYIRFPTDGLNLRNTQYRWKSEGMDKESALNSFLKYARENIKAPIGIDIYGANGWYRSGTRTGQDVEMLAQYVDVIGPMFYPSHFEQNFLNYEPFAERPYRIYFYGNYRNTVMARNRSIIRPWVQAFYLNVSYDRQYYNKDYVIQQIYGTRDSVDHGYMYWNNSGDYSYISPDVGTTPYPWNTFESSTEFKKPALGTEKAPEKDLNLSAYTQFSGKYTEDLVTEFLERSKMQKEEVKESQKMHNQIPLLKIERFN